MWSNCPLPNRILLFCLTTVFAIGVFPASANLVINGDFEAGNTGFWTDYPFFTGPGQLPADYYALVENPSDWHVVGRDYGDHTTGSGLMMMVNGHTTPDQTVWGQTLTVTPNTDHDISIWVSNWSTGHAADLNLFINDVHIGNFSSVGLGTWSEYTTNWNSGPNSSAVIRIVDYDTASAGNDFSLDDISVTAFAIDVPLDIKPTSCPNAFNSGQQGVNPTAILGTMDFDVSMIDLTSILLNLPGGSIAPIRTEFEDVAAPMPLEPNPCECTTDGPDGFVDLTLKFDAQEVTAALVDPVPGDEFEICITGTLLDGTPFEGCDCIIILGPVYIESSTWGSVKSLYQ